MKTSKIFNKHLSDKPNSLLNRLFIKTTLTNPQEIEIFPEKRVIHEPQVDFLHKTQQSVIPISYNSEETARPLINRMNNAVQLHARKLLSGLKRLANLSIPSTEQTHLINDLAASNSLSTNDIKENVENTFIYRLYKKITLNPIHPFEKHKICVDIFLFLNTLLLFFYIPFTMGFDFLSSQKRDIFQKIQFGIYSADMIMNLNTSYIDNGLIVKERMKVCNNYLRTLFLWDLLTMISLLGKNDYIPSGESDPYSVYIQLLFFSKFKLFQVRFKNIKEIFCLDTKLKGIFDLLVLLITTIFFAHFFACIFRFMANNSEYAKNWVHVYGINDKSLEDQYLYSLYWSTVTMMTVGYGDIVAQNPSEMFFSVIAILVGCIIVGYNISKIGNIFQDMNKEEKKIQDNINKLNQFMKAKRINNNLQMRIRAYLKFLSEKQHEKLNNDLLKIIDTLSDSLKEELYLQGYGDIIRNYNLFSNNFSYECLSTLIRYMKEETFMKNDVILTENENNKKNLYFIILGEIEIFRTVSDNSPSIILKKLKEKESFGEYSFLTGKNNYYSAKASTYSQVYKISHENFIEVLSKFPKDYEKYSEIRDKINFYKGYESYNLRCVICNKKDHINNECRLMHYIPNKENILLKHLFTQDQPRKQYKRKKILNFNALNEKTKIVKKIGKFMSNSHFKENEDDDSFDEIEEIPSNDSPKNKNKKKYSFNNDKEEIPFIKEEYSNKKPFFSTKLQKIELNDSFSIDDENPANLDKLINSLYTPEKPESKDFVLDIDHAKKYEFYFPEGNYKDFMEKNERIRAIHRKSIRKHKPIDKQVLFKREQTRGYALFQNNLGEKSQNKEKLNENLKLKSFLNRNNSHMFFMKKESEKPKTFMQLIEEAKEKKNKEKNKN